MAGVLNYKRYLNTLQTLTEVGNIFPGDQKTYTFTVGGTTSTQGWTATVSWETLIIDEMSYGKNNIPDFTDSKVLGIYTGTTISQYTTGTISIPANMYTGPILPAHVVNVPVTIVNIAWTKDGDNFANNIAYIQNWEPGVPINDPATGDGFEPVVSEPSTLTLTGPGGVIYQRSIELKAETDIPLYLGTTTRCYFYWDKAGGRELLGVAYFDPNTNIATLNYNTSGTQFTGGTYPIYAETNGFRQYGFARSNTLQQVVYEHIPLLFVSESRTPPNPSTDVYPFTYRVGEEFVFSQTFQADPSYPPSPNPVSNVVRLYLRDAGQYQRAVPRILATTTFTNGVVSITQPITLDMFDLSAGAMPDYGPYNDFTSLSTGTLVGNTFTCVISVKNYYSFNTFWEVDFNGPYAAGSRIGGGSFTAEYLVDRVITGEAYPITLTQDLVTTYTTQNTRFTVTKPARPHGGYIKLMGRQGNTGSFTELANFNNVGGNGTTETVETTALTTGTWTLYASFAGDLGTSYRVANKNLASTSNTLTHYVIPGQDLPVAFTFQRTANYDIIRVNSSYDARTLPKYVSFYQGATLINTATWFRSTSTVVDVTTSTLYEQSTALLNSFSDLQGGFQNPNKYTLFRTPSFFESTSTYFANPYETRTNHRGYTNARTGEVVDPWVTLDGSSSVIALQRQIENSFPRVLKVNVTYGPWYDLVTREISITLTSYIGKFSDTMYLYRIQRGLPPTGQKYVAQRSNVTPDLVGTSIPSDANFKSQFRNVPQPLGTTYMETSEGHFYQRTSSDQSLPWRITDYFQFNVIGYTFERHNPPNLWRDSGYSYLGTNGDIWSDWKYGQEFGKRSWSAANPTNATQVSDAQYYNDVYTALQQKLVATVTSATYTTPTIYNIEVGDNVAELLLPVGTIYNAEILRATWPGTLDLDGIYGKFNPFEVSPVLAPSTAFITSRDMATVDAHVNPFRPTYPDSPYAANPTVEEIPLQDPVISSNNFYNLTVTVTVANGGYENQAFGTATFYDVDTDQDLATVSVSTGTGVWQMSAGDFPSVAPGEIKRVDVGVRFNSSIVADCIAPPYALVINRSALDMIPYQFSRYMKNELGQDVTEYDYTIPVVPYISPTVVKTILRSDYPGLQVPGRLVSVYGSYFNVEHPHTRFKGICSAYNNQDIYGQAVNKAGYWDRSSNFFFVFRYTIVGGTYNGQQGWFVPPQFSQTFNNICIYNKFDSRRTDSLGPQNPAKYTLNNVINGIEGNAGGLFIVRGGVNKLRWIDDWTRIDIEVSAVGASFYNRGIASLDAGAKLGIQGVWNVTYMTY